jgi:translation initiation factor 2B subunit (eIF-2B alpha/beta/delta family)
MPSFADDRSSGSTDVARAFLDDLARWAEQDRTPDPAAFRAALIAWLRRAQAAQPSMALVHQLAARALDVLTSGLQRGDGLGDLRGHVVETCHAEHEDLEGVQSAVARTAASLLGGGRGGWIATLSASGMVRDALIEARRRGLEPSALVAEARPGREGRAMATALAHAGIPVWFVVDAALPMLISQARAVWIGADAVTEFGVINKVGSYAAALAAREHSVPVYALAGRRKFIPATTPALQILEMSPAEVWDAPAPDVQPRNVYYEVVPLALLRGVVVEDTVLGPAEVVETARDRGLPEELAAR